MEAGVQFTCNCSLLAKEREMGKETQVEKEHEQNQKMIREKEQQQKTTPTVTATGISATILKNGGTGGKRRIKVESYPIN